MGSDQTWHFFTRSESMRAPRLCAYSFKNRKGEVICCYRLINLLEDFIGDLVERLRAHHVEIGGGDKLEDGASSPLRRQLVQHLLPAVDFE